MAAAHVHGVDSTRSFGCGAKCGYSRSSADWHARWLAWAPSLLEFERPVPQHGDSEPPLNADFDAYITTVRYDVGDEASLGSRIFFVIQRAAE